jgi:outer membrane protein assembly factor BamD
MLGYKHIDPLKFLLAGLLCLASLSGCGLLPEKIDETKNWSVNQLYTNAKEASDAGNYKIAIGYFEKLQARYPFGRYAQQAQLELIYANYKDNEPDLAIAAADRFIKSNPRHPFVDYAYYMKGLVNFTRGSGTLDRFLPGDPTRTDTATIRQSFNDFSELVQKFPNSKYANDARQRLVFLHNNLATYEVHVAEYYLHRGAYVAAVNRAKYVLENYSRTPAVPDALAVMAEAYIKLGMNDLATDTTRVLRLNYPDSPHLPRLTALLEGKEKSSFSIFGLSS